MNMCQIKKIYEVLLLTFFTIFFVLFLCFISATADKAYTITYIENDSARIDILPTKGDDLNLHPATKGRISNPGWSKNAHGQGFISIFSPILNRWKTETIDLLPDRDGEISIYLRGPWNEDNIPIVVEYRNLLINGHKIDLPSPRIWHDNPFQYHFDVKEKQPVHVSVEVRKPWVTIFNIMKHHHINIYVLLSLTILILLGLYKIYGYMSKQKTFNYIDTILIVFFFMLLFLPMSNISKDVESKTENRILATKPILAENGDLNVNFGTQFDTWFNDHFWGRNYLISLSSKIHLFINKVYVRDKALYIKKNNWMFSTQKLSIPNSGQHKEILHSLKTVKELSKQHDIKLYLLITPYKNSVYKDILHQDYVYNDSEIDAFNGYIKKLGKEIGIPIIYPYDELIQAQNNDFVYFKQSHHWTDWGAYNGYKALINVISKDFNDLTIITLSKFTQFSDTLIRDGWNQAFNIGHTTHLLGFDEYYAREYLLKDGYKYYDKTDDIIVPKVNKNIKYFSNLSGKYKIFIMGNSQNDNLMHFLPYSANKLKYIRLNQGNYLSSEEENKFLKYYKKDLLDFHPDIFIISITAEDMIKYLIDMARD